jgi:hypothetical protein
MQKTIDRKMFEQMCNALEDMYGETQDQEEAKDMVLELLAIQGVEVEPEPCLPKITQGAWRSGQARDDSCWEIWADSATEGRVLVAYNVRRKADAYLIAAAPRVVQAAVNLIIAADRAGMVSDDMRQELREAVIAAGVSSETFDGKGEILNESV